MSLLDSLIEDELFTPPLVIGSEAARELWICLRKDGGTQIPFGSGTQDDPYDGSTADKFDFVMSHSVVAGATVRIGPGEFQTRGGVGAGWFAQNGRIVGSGTYVTTLKLIGVTTVGEARTIIFNFGGITQLEVSDLTLDANMGGQADTSPYCYARVCTQGIGVSGANIAVRRVRVINAGTQTPISSMA